jgi:hypothetical protein
MGTKVAVQEIWLETQGLFFHKVAYIAYDVTAEMFQSGNNIVSVLVVTQSSVIWRRYLALIWKRHAER